MTTHLDFPATPGNQDPPNYYTTPGGVTYFWNGSEWVLYGTPGFVSMAGTNGAQMSGRIKLSGDPVSSLEAATKQYVDNATSGEGTYSNLTLTGELRGPASFIIDPAAIGDNTGTVTIKGNLQVDGDTTTINSETLTVDDKNIVLASGAADAAAANTAGITVDGANASLVYTSSGDKWVLNKVPYYNTNRLLTTADEGSGNGLDADTVDGQHASSFSASTHNHNAAYLALSGGTLTGDIGFSGSQTVDGYDVSVLGAKLATIDANADVTNAANVAIAGAVMESDTTTALMDFVLDQDNLSSNSATKLATQQSIKAYVDAQTGTTNLSTTQAATTVSVNSDTGTNASISAATASVGGIMTNAMFSKLDGIESGATADQTNAEIRAAVAAASDSNVFTNSYKTKLDGIASGAEVNVQSDWNATTGDSFIQNKPTLNFLPLAGGTLTGDLDINAKVDISNDSTSPAIDTIGPSSNTSYNYIIRGKNDGGNCAVHFVNNTNRTADGGANAYTIRNDGGKLILGRSNQNTVLEGTTLKHGTNVILTAANYTTYAAGAAHDHDAVYYKKTGGTLTGNLQINSDAPTIELIDTGGSGARFWYHNDNGQLTIRTNYGSGTGWSGDTPLVLTNSSKEGNLYGNRLLTTADEGSGNGLDADTLRTYIPNTSNTANTIALRNNSADIYARLFRSTYQNQSTIGGAMAFRTSTTDNYIRFCNSPSAVRAWLGALGSNVANQKVQSYFTITRNSNHGVLEFEDSNGAMRMHVYHYNAGDNGGIGVFDSSGANRSDLLLYRGGNMTWRNSTVFTSGINCAPATDSTYNLGSTSLRWANVYADNFHGEDLHIHSTSTITTIKLSNSDVEGVLQAYTDSHFELRTITNHPIFFKTNGNNIRMTVEDDGKVGIGRRANDYPLEVSGGMGLYPGSSGGSSYIEVGKGQAGNGYAYVDLIGDATYTDYGFRIIRDNDGANSGTDLIHRGTGRLRIETNEAADIEFWTSNTRRMEIYANGEVAIGGGSNGDSRLKIYKADNNVADHLQFYNGTTRVGEIGCEDSDWLYINKETAKNIRTPRYIQADQGFFISPTSGYQPGINYLGNFFAGNNLEMRPSSSTATCKQKIGETRSGNGYSYIDLIGDDTYSDYGLRLLRGNGGANTWSGLYHRGTGGMYIIAYDSASLYFRTANTDRMQINSSGEVSIFDRLAVEMPSNYWAQGSTYINVSGFGGLGTHGSYEVTLTAGGYRKGSSEWEDYTIAGYSGFASQVACSTLNGKIFFRCDSGKTTGSGSGLTTRMTIEPSGEVSIGAGTNTESRLKIYRADDGVSDHIQFYRNTTRMGEIGCQDTAWLRINQTTNTNIYTPRVIRADGGFFVDGSSKGINGSGNFIGGTIAGASDYGTLLRSDANDVIGGVLSYHSNDARLQFRNTSYDKYLYIGGWSSANSSGISRIRNSNANLHIDSGSDGNLHLNWYASNRTIYLGNTGQTVRAAGSYLVWHEGNDGSGSGLDADKLDGYNSSASSDGNTIALRKSAADIYARLFRSTYQNQSTISGAIAYRVSTTDNYIRFCTDKAAIRTFLDVTQSASLIRSDADDNVSAHTEWQDNKQIRLGNGADFRMYWNGSHTYFRNYSHANGNIYFMGENSSGTNKALFYMYTEGERPFSILYEDGGERLRTQTNGVRVYGSNPAILRLQDAGHTNTYTDFQHDNTALNIIARGGSSYCSINFFQYNGTTNRMAAKFQSGGNFYPGTTDTFNLGNGNNRWKRLFAVTATSVSSDRDLKQDIEELNEKEKKVAVTLKGLIRKYRLISEVQKTGDKAKIHIGVIAQDVGAAFEAEGLDPNEYELYENEMVYEDADGNECSQEDAVTSTRCLGIIYSELLAFIISAL